MGKIEKLSPEQIAKFPEYVEKYVKIGLCTDRIDTQTARDISAFYYEKIAGKKKVPTIIMRSPFEAWAAVYHYSSSPSQLYNLVFNQPAVLVGNQVVYQIQERMRERIPEALRLQVIARIFNQVYDQVFKQVYDQVFKQVRSRSFEQALPVFTIPYLNSARWCADYSLYDFFNMGGNLVPPYKEKYNWLKKTLEIGLFYPLDNICIISERPVKIFRKGNSLHNEKGAAIEYSDGFSVYVLNEIRVPEWIVKTDKDDITVEQLLKIENADIRRECLRKMGVNKLINHGKSIDKNNGYELIDLGSFFVGRGNFYAPYLVMENPSVKGLWHAEGVHEDCKTVLQALNWRNQSQKSPVKLT